MLRATGALDRPVLIVIALAAAMPLWVSAYILGVLTVAYYFGVFAMSWDLLFGFAGEVNFGPTFLIGLGAYAAAMLEQRARPAALRLRAWPAAWSRCWADCCSRCRRCDCAARISA